MSDRIIGIDAAGRALASLAFMTKGGESMFEAIDGAADKMPHPWKSTIKQVLGARTPEKGINVALLDGLNIDDFLMDIEDLDPESIITAAHMAAKGAHDRVLESNVKAVLADHSKTIQERLALVRELEAGKEPERKHGLPAIVAASSLCLTPIPEPAQVIKGLLHRGSKLVFGGPSKAFKSWNLIDLCVAVSTGQGWLGWATMDEMGPGRALYINLELQPFAIQRRINALCDARSIDAPANLDIWNLRGTGASMTQLLHALPDGATYDLIVPDPLYKLYGPTRKENDVSDMASLMAEIEEMADITGAAVAAGAHFAKGLASVKEHLDRISGSGVFARDPDAFVTATPHEEDGGFVIETTLRNFAPIEPFSVRWEFPQMVRASDLDPKHLKGKGGRPAEYTDKDITAHLKPGMTTGQWMKQCREETGMSERKFYQLLKNIRDDIVTNSCSGWVFNNGSSCSKNDE